MKKFTALFLVLVLLLTLTACGEAISEPVAGDDAAPVYNNQPLTEEQKLLETGVPAFADSTKPSVRGFSTNLLVNGEAVTAFSRAEKIDFTGAYTPLEGIITFRGDNYRSGAAYGTAKITEKKFDTNMWTVETGTLKKTTGSGNWTGSGWTGQPLIIRWDDATRSAMNLYPEKKAKQGLTEVIYATMDGNIYFLDLDDGSATRDKISLGFPIKGTGSLYPTGIPLYFVGAGDSMGEKCARTFVVDLVQGKVIYEYGYDDTFALRKDNNSFTAYDSSPLIDAATDTLIQPGENGILYTTKLNVQYDGTSLSIDPSDVVKWRYSTDRTGEESYWYGMESSAVIWHGYLYVADNSGDLMCIDLNTMELIWSQDILDDSNASPVFEEDAADGTGYIYISTSLHWTQDDGKKGDIPIYKINAATGEIIWQRSYPCETVDGVSGGVQATALLGQQKISDLVYFNVARTGGKDKGKIVAVNKKTGGEVWSCTLANYSWSSPIAIYDEQGNGYVILCDSDGNMFLLDGRTGECYDKINLGKNVEASPAAFGNTIVVGTRGQKICGVTVK